MHQSLFTTLPTSLHTRLASLSLVSPQYAMSKASRGFAGTSPIERFVEQESPWPRVRQERTDCKDNASDRKLMLSERWMLIIASIPIPVFEFRSVLLPRSRRQYTHSLYQYGNEPRTKQRDVFSQYWLDPEYDCPSCPSSTKGIRKVDLSQAVCMALSLDTTPRQLSATSEGAHCVDYYDAWHCDFELRC